MAMALSNLCTARAIFNVFRSYDNANNKYIVCNRKLSHNECSPCKRLAYYPLEKGSNPRPTFRARGRRQCFVNKLTAAEEKMKPPFNVLITGSTKGIGFALAKEFLRAGDNVIICSRSDGHVQSAMQNLKEEFGEHHVWGTTCDVRDADSVKALVEFGRNNLGYIDIWINNAGSNAYSYRPLVETSDEALMEVVTTNTLGLMICCREAIKMMINQPRGGHIFNMDGAGADGRATPRQSYRCKRSKRLWYIIYHQVAKYLVRCIRSIPGRGSSKPTYIRFLTGFKAYSQIFARLAFNARKNRYVIED